MASPDVTFAHIVRFHFAAIRPGTTLAARAAWQTALNWPKAALNWPRSVLSWPTFAKTRVQLTGTRVELADFPMSYRFNRTTKPIGAQADRAVGVCRRRVRCRQRAALGAAGFLESKTSAHGGGPVGLAGKPVRDWSATDDRGGAVAPLPATARSGGGQRQTKPRI